MNSRFFLVVFLLATVLKTDIYRLFVPGAVYEEDVYKTVLNDLVHILKKMKKDIDLDFDEAFKMWGLKK